MKKTMVILAAMAAIGAFSTSVFASDVFVKLGYNLAGQSELAVEGNYTLKSDPETLISSGGGGLVITAGASFDVTDEIGIKTSVSFDHMNKVFENGRSLSWSRQQDDGSYFLVEVDEEYWYEAEVNKWTINADLLGSYNLVKSNPNLKAGVLLGANFVYTNAYDLWVQLTVSQYELDYDKDYEEDIEENNFDLNNKVNGFGIVAGGFVDYSMNDKLDLSLEGYIGALNFGNLVNGLSNFKISASASYEVLDDVDVTASFTFANAKFNKLIYYNTIELGYQAIEYTYKQLVPTIGVTYNF